MQHDGLFIALEGIDGAGKTTQSDLLQRRLELAGYDVVRLKFPQYDKPSSYFITQYLNGAYGTLDQVGPYTAALFYALDRYAAARQIREALAAGKVVLADRFVGSNMAHQGAKIAHPEERRGFFIWLDNLEFRLLQTPRPDYSFVLRIPAAVAQERIGQKGKREYTDATHDLHEADRKHLELTAIVYDDMCQLFPRDFSRVDCSRDNRLLSIDQVHELLWGKVEPLLPARQPQTAPAALATKPTFYVPITLKGKTKKQYEAGVRSLLEKQAAIAERLSLHSAAHGPENNGDHTEPAAQLLLPVAALTTTQKIVHDEQYSDIPDLQRTYSDDSEPVSLVAYWPRNELDIVPYLLYTQSNQSFKDTARTVGNLAYVQKAQILREALTFSKLPSALRLMSYTWDVVSDYRSFLELRLALPNAPYSRQALTPRLGYDMPDAIEATKLIEDFEACFDTSLELYSILQAAGKVHEAEYVTLLGHRVRWQTTLTLDQLLSLSSPPTIVDTLTRTISEVHPLVSELLHDKRQARSGQSETIHS